LGGESNIVSFFYKGGSSIATFTALEEYSNAFLLLLFQCHTLYHV